MYEIVAKPPPMATHSLDALTGTLARALAGARHPQVEAARRAQLRRTVGGSPMPGDAAASRHCDRLASRCRRYHTLGVVGRLRSTAAR
ncbi:hypothetical protein [Frankia sp. Cppng1_Ct_nod]|uniref:hypothetical protein n=1 Tax=Frankia sp. Cppng1_Ct_nod TaxID=2897162 RepID=UPI00202492F8|nr:hypothetical protein [Frankia sp. Cppng1_Ct_nod]